MTPNQNRKAFLDMIAISEIGPKLLAVSDNGYNVIVGSTPEHPILMTSYSDHPRRRIWIPKIKDFSSAAGRYQILSRNFDAYKKSLKLPDFGPASQDRIAIQLIRECGALVLIEKGRIEESIFACRSRWASLPGAGYKQHENKLDTLLAAYRSAGGEFA
jgi:muramidase (phage lysozyme)